ncbi:hypothetical protein ACH5RR_003577 [Cinchona calisaya]|uniref:TF-B3 domain-containing protein n=1 Tax=Cinchona calisaya TaxID=153742 RepID=A0ABD3AVJ2_9GENT
MLTGSFDLDGHKARAKARKRLGPYGFDIFKSGKHSQPKNPYFVTKLRAKRMNELFVPADVVRDHNLNLPSEIILRDPQGRAWTAKLRHWSDGRRWYCGGWRKLCRLNLVIEKDTCICEFVKRRNQGLFIKVTFIRVEDDASIQNK